MRKIQITITSFLVLLALLINIGPALAVPPLPSSFYGKVSLNGSNLLEGTVVEAIIDEKVISESQTLIYLGESVYSIDINGDDPGTVVIEGGKENDVVRFRIGGLMAKETGIWHSGTNVELILTINTSETPQPPEPTKTPIPTQTSIVQPTQIPTPTPTLVHTATATLVHTATPTAAATLIASEGATTQPASIISTTPTGEFSQPIANQEITQPAAETTKSESEISATVHEQQDLPESTNTAYLLKKAGPSSENGLQSQNHAFLTILVISVITLISGILIARYLKNKKMNDLHKL